MAPVTTQEPGSGSSALPTLLLLAGCLIGLAACGIAAAAFYALAPFQSSSSSSSAAKQQKHRRQKRPIWNNANFATFSASASFEASSEKIRATSSVRTIRSVASSSNSVELMPVSTPAAAAKAIEQLRDRSHFDGDRLDWRRRRIFQLGGSAKQNAEEKKDEDEEEEEDEDDRAERAKRLRNRLRHQLTRRVLPSRWNMPAILELAEAASLSVDWPISTTKTAAANATAAATIKAKSAGRFRKTKGQQLHRLIPWKAVRVRKPAVRCRSQPQRQRQRLRQKTTAKRKRRNLPSATRIMDALASGLISLRPSSSASSSSTPPATEKSATEIAAVPPQENKPPKLLQSSSSSSAVDVRPERQSLQQQRQAKKPSQQMRLRLRLTSASSGTAALEQDNRRQRRSLAMPLSSSSSSRGCTAESSGVKR